MESLLYFYITIIVCSIHFCNIAVLADRLLYDAAPNEPFATPIIATIKSKSTNKIEYRYSNPFKGWKGLPPTTEVIKNHTWFAKYNQSDSHLKADPETLSKRLPVRQLTPDSFKESSFRGKLSATWLGHATALLRLHGVNIITDPVWLKKASPKMAFFLNYDRYRPMPVEIDQLPKLNIGVISHNHLDHYDVDSIRKIIENSPNIHWFVPKDLNLKSEFIKESNITVNVTELTWGEAYEYNIKSGKVTVKDIPKNENDAQRRKNEMKDTIVIMSIPAQHWSLPVPVLKPDTYESLWSGWLFMGPEYRVYYAGDTGFCREEFEKVGKKFGPIDLVITPIGCYKPDEYMESQHMHPARSVEIFKLTKARHLLGVHWGTFNMKAFEHFYDPFLDLRYAVKQEIRLRNELRKYSKGGNLSKGISDIVSEIKSKFLSPNAKENALTEFTSTVDYSLNGKDLLEPLKRCRIFTLEHGQTWSIEEVETYEEDFCTPYA
ncbi:beta-lactamase superfamily domain-containing protein [Ditylenchus destructor]|nr:beta-lactamase superfamily domain-containing protein [Ditylenchus destructor]